MSLYLLIAACVIGACVLLNKVSDKIGIPMLLAFMVLGMLFGSDGILGIEYSDFPVTEKICTVKSIKNPLKSTLLRAVGKQVSSIIEYKIYGRCLFAKRTYFYKN